MINRLKIGLFNTNGLNRSTDEIIQQCQLHHIDIILLTETFLVRGRLNTDWIQLHTYAIQEAHHDKGFGGLTLLVRPDLNLHVHQLPYHNNHTLSFRLGDYTFHGLYLPPALSNAQCTERLDCLRIDDHTIILGDLNARLRRFGDHNTNVRGTAVLDPWLTDNGLCGIQVGIVQQYRVN